jgi:hypothetical protein
MSRGRVYAVTFSAVAVSAAQDLFEITPADDKPCQIVGIELGQSSDAGDAADELLQVSIIRGFTASGSGGSSATPAAMNPGDGAAGFSAEVNNTTVANTGSSVTLQTTCWNVRGGYINWFPEGAEPMASQANTTLVVRSTAPADAVTMSGTLYVREL